MNQSEMAKQNYITLLEGLKAEGLSSEEAIAFLLVRELRSVAIELEHLESTISERL